MKPRQLQLPRSRPDGQPIESSQLDRRGIAALEASGIPWTAVQRWLDELEPSEAFVARRLVKQVLQALADDKAPLRERFEARNELYRRMIAAGIVE